MNYRTRLVELPLNPTMRSRLLSHSRLLHILTKNVKEHILSKTAITIFILNFLVLLWYIFFEYRLEFHSDAAAKVLLAREMLTTKSFFPSDWNYVNSDLWIFFGNVFIAPLLLAIPAGYFSHAWAELVTAILVLIGASMLLKLTQCSTTRRWVILACFAGGISPLTAAIIYGEGAYGIDFFLSCCLIYTGWHTINSPKKIISAAGFFVVIVLVAWGNPSRAIVYFVAPAIASGVYLLIQSLNKSEKLTKSIYFIIILAGSLLGSALHLYSFSSTQNSIGAANAQWLDVTTGISNITLTLKHLILIYGLVPPAGEKVSALASGVPLIRFFIALVIIGLLPACMKIAFKKGAPQTGFIAVHLMSLIGIVLLFQLMTSIPALTYVHSARYLTQPALLALLLILSNEISKSSRLISIGTATVFVVLSTSAPRNLTELNQPNSYTFHEHQEPSIDNDRLASFLSPNELRYGYASFWNAGNISVLSEEKSLVRQINIRDGLVTPYRWLSSDRWYLPDTWRGPTFLLLTQAEARQVDLAKMAAYGAIAIDKLTIGNYLIYTFRDNLALHLPNWNDQIGVPYVYKMGPSTMHGVGSVIWDTEAKAYALQSKAWDNGYLHYGPYITYFPGTYEVTFEIEQSSPFTTVVLDVFSASIIVEKTLTSQLEKKTVRFTIDKTSQLEFRVRVFGPGQTTLRSISVTKLDKPKVRRFN